MQSSRVVCWAYCPASPPEVPSIIYLWFTCTIQPSILLPSGGGAFSPRGLLEGLQILLDLEGEMYLKHKTEIDGKVFTFCNGILCSLIVPVLTLLWRN